MIKKIIFTCLFIIILVCCKKTEEVKEIVSDNKSDYIPVTIVKAVKAEFNEYFDYYGRTQGINRASIKSVTGGNVESIAVKEGAIVKVGDSLGSVSLERAKLVYETAVLNERISKENYLNQKRFLESGSSTPLDVDRSNLAWLNSKGQLLDAKKAYDSAMCLSPIDGVVVLRNINLEDDISPGEDMFLIEDLSVIEMHIGIPEEEIKGIHEGSIALVTTDIYPERVWNGKITRLSRRSSERNLTYDAIVTVKNTDGTLMSGSTAKVRILGNSYKNIVVPSEVVLRDGEESYVMVAKGDKAERRVVQIAANNSEEIVISSGLQEGDTLIREGLHLLKDSQDIKILEGV